MRACGSHDFAMPPKERVADFQDTQIWPGARPHLGDRLQQLVGRAVRVVLSQDQRRRRRRARHAGVAMDQHMIVLSLTEFAAKREHQLDVPLLRYRPFGVRINDVVKP